MLPSRTYQNVSNIVKEVNSSEKSAVIESPGISVIVAVLNGAKCLSRCIESVAGQTQGAYELVIIDGGSTDGSDLPPLKQVGSGPRISTGERRGMVRKRFTAGEIIGQLRTIEIEGR